MHQNYSSSPTYHKLLGLISNKMKNFTPTDVANITLTTADDMTKKFAKLFFFCDAHPVKRAILTGTFGTGKTNSVKQQIEKLATHRKRNSKTKILVIVPLSESSLLVQDFRRFSEQFSSVEVRCIPKSGEFMKMVY